MAPPAPSKYADAALKQSVALALKEFVESDYAVQLCHFCNYNPTDCGQIGGMFESLRLVDTTLEVKLTMGYTQKSVPLLERLADHLRARAPQVKRLKYSFAGSFGQTRMWILSNAAH